MYYCKDRALHTPVNESIAHDRKVEDASIVPNCPNDQFVWPKALLLNDFFESKLRPVTSENLHLRTVLEYRRCCPYSNLTAVPGSSQLIPR